MSTREPLRSDPYLVPYTHALDRRRSTAAAKEAQLVRTHIEAVRKGASSEESLARFALGHDFFGLHKKGNEWVFSEWAPNATAVFLIGDFTNWKEHQGFALTRVDDNGTWQIRLPGNTMRHGDHYRLRVCWDGGAGDRIPSYARRVVQDHRTKIFCAQVWDPKPYEWRHDDFRRSTASPLIYEAHVGMAVEREGVGTYEEFRKDVLPRIAAMGYNTIQLMGIMEHPYYGSFGYHVSNFFAASSRFGTPEELKALVDDAHRADLAVTIDLVHSHSVRNEVEGLSRFDGSEHQFFHAGGRGWHDAWDSRCFDYGKNGVLHFLLSNCRFWLDEYKVDGFRFDGITSMLYLHHGLGPGFNSYDDYFDGSVDEDAVTYLTLANRLIHQLRPDAVTIAEDVSGMPGLAAPIEEGGCGFDFRLAMGVPDCWFKLVNDVRDEDWSMGTLWRELVNRRRDERTISYVESHDQALVGGKTLIFEMGDAAMYEGMSLSDHSIEVDRAMALHKMARLITIATAGDGYLTFIGNEFGHPEWVDFPREGNDWSYRYARRQWSLRDNPDLKYGRLADFDRAMVTYVAERALLEQTDPRVLLVEEERKLIAFERAGSYFFFNFHPDRSFSDLEIVVPPGEYRLVCDTDEARFAGHNRIAANQRYFTHPRTEGNERKDLLSLYLPNRSALVLERLA